MNITIIGTGYVGLVTGVCFSEMGNKVYCVDIDEKKIGNLKKGILPIYEPGLEELLRHNYEQNNIIFTTDLKEGLDNTDICFIAVGTPLGDDGSANLEFVYTVSRQIGQNMAHDMIVVDKSTVPVGTAQQVKENIQKELNKREVNYKIDVISNPEFLKEGHAIQDFMSPDRVIIGSDNPEVTEVMNTLYEPFTMKNQRLISMDIRSAEMTKYAANSMLATRISFINEIANICDQTGADINQVRKGIGSDTRIGYSFLYPGCGYGGSCFPKDVNALIKTAKDNGYNPELLKSVDNVNNNQKYYLIKKIIDVLGEDLSNYTFTVWGLSFKPETDDMREAPSIIIINELIKHGAKIQAYDPQSMKIAKKYYFKDIKEITYFNNKYDALKDSNAIILITEWKEFRSPDFRMIKNSLKTNLIFDGRNQYDKKALKNLDIEYYSIGN
ncbi:MAG: UDP-glucose/GDP-mannose dehydrogenase family protein [Methanobacteriaceae archaeon]|nr:UDP-glucose/GDP-mannose dehydrogenase family protein [Methanobacteriaceae archaeon]